MKRTQRLPENAACYHDLMPDVPGQRPKITYTSHRINTAGKITLGTQSMGTGTWQRRLGMKTFRGAWEG